MERGEIEVRTRRLFSLRLRRATLCQDTAKRPAQSQGPPRWKSSLKSILTLLALRVLTMISSAFADDTTKIAFVDTGNTVGSVTTVALAVAFIKDSDVNVAVISRAVDLNPINLAAPEPNAAILLKHRGITVSAHRTEQLTINDVRAPAWF